MHTSKPVEWKPVLNILPIIITVDNITLKMVEKITRVPDLPIQYAGPPGFIKLNKKLYI